MLLSLCGWGAAGSAKAQEGSARAEQLARASPTATQALAYLQRSADRLGPKSAALKQAVLELLKNPRPAFMSRLETSEAQEKVRGELVAAGLLEPEVTSAKLFPPLPAGKAAPQAFLSAPANGLHGHHSYPGGLAEHTAFNVQTATGLAEIYDERYHLNGALAVDRDTLVGAAILHDIMKPWLLQWRGDGTLTAQAKVAGTAAHHPYAVAEAFYRRLPAELIVVLASAHDTPLGATEARVVGFLRAGAILAGVDPVALGVLRKEGETFRLARPPSVEAVVHHLSDHDYVLTEPAAQLTDAMLDRMAKAEAATGAGSVTDASLRWMHYRIQSQLPGVTLYRLFSEGGEAAVSQELQRRKLKLVVASDGR